jgi:uncharacterized membrane-anchored protein YitT (DUF2179 family)
MSKRLVVTVLFAIAVNLYSMTQASGINGWTVVLEHLLLSLVGFYLLFSLIAFVMAWFRLDNLIKRAQDRANGTQA